MDLHFPVSFLSKKEEKKKKNEDREKGTEDVGGEGGNITCRTTSPPLFITPDVRWIFLAVPSNAAFFIYFLFCFSFKSTPLSFPSYHAIPYVSMCMPLKILSLMPTTHIYLQYLYSHQLPIYIIFF